MFEYRKGSEVGYGAARRREIERAMRAHPAGSALAGRAGGAPSGRPHVESVGVAPAPLRLTARGRRLAAVLAVTAGVGTAAVVGSVVHASGTGALHLAGESSVVVRSGDTLWSIASSVAGDGDVREVVARIREVNGLAGSGLVPGQVLTLP
jgi:nucleoid-associated protein YgaU